MNSQKIFDNIHINIMKAYRIFCYKKSVFHYKKLFRLNNIKLKKLTHDEKKQVDKIWTKVGKYDYVTHKFVKTVTGKFDPYIVPEYLFRTKIELILNHPVFKNSWSDKAYFNLFCPDVKFPDTVVRNINGVFYDNKYNVITKEQAIEIISENENYVIKPSLDSGFGRGVLLVKGVNDTKDILSKYCKNYVVQRVFKQHQIISQFNKSSVNVIRFISLFINGEVMCATATLRCGAEGAFNDSSITDDGRGMFVIGIDENGCLKNRAYHSCGVSISQCPNGTQFAGVEIPGFEKMKYIIKNTHKKMAYFGFIGWDFAVDEMGEPIVMEYNIKGPGVLYYQYANGSLFGKYTDKVCEFICRSHVENER